jgi:hypothetical protein
LVASATPVEDPVDKVVAAVERHQHFDAAIALHVPKGIAARKLSMRVRGVSSMIAQSGAESAAATAQVAE